MQRDDSLEKTDAGRDWRQEEKGTAEDEMAGWHHGLDGHESEWTPGVGDGRGGLACCDSWGHKESDTTERLNWTELNWTELNARMELYRHIARQLTTEPLRTYRNGGVEIRRETIKDGEWSGARDELVKRDSASAKETFQEGSCLRNSAAQRRPQVWSEKFAWASWLVGEKHVRFKWRHCYSSLQTWWLAAQKMFVRLMKE